MIKSLYVKALVGVSMLATTAAHAQSIAVSRGVGNSPTHSPEIDGPAGVAAIALLVSAGIMAYHRLRK